MSADLTAAFAKGSPEMLVTEIAAALRVRDFDRAREARGKLQSQFGVKLLFGDELEADE